MTNFIIVLVILVSVIIAVAVASNQPDSGNTQGGYTAAWGFFLFVAISGLVYLAFITYPKRAELVDKVSNRLKAVAGGGRRAPSPRMRSFSRGGY